MWRVRTVTKLKKKIPVLTYWNDNRIHLGNIKKLNFSIWFPPPTIGRTIEWLATTVEVYYQYQYKILGLPPLGQGNLLSIKNYIIDI